MLSFDIMKRRLDKNMYVRLDHFQEDLFSIFERARRYSKVDSRMFLDAITLQTEYMRIRSVWSELQIECVDSLYL